MIFLNLPAKMIGILGANISSREIALGVCLGMFLGFTPLNGTTALLLAVFFFVFRINRMATLLTLPLFKALYLLGISGVADNIGLYFLERADFLVGFWRFVTNLPVIAYLDINRTTVAGGLILLSVMSIPVYFIAKRISAPLLAKYSEKMRNTAFSKWIKKFYYASALIGTDADSVMDNVGSTAKSEALIRIRSTAKKMFGSKPKTGIMKRVNLTGIGIISGALLLIHFGVGLVISPIVRSAIIDGLNRFGAAKITVERINVWPLTLSFSMKDLKVFDAKRRDKIIAEADSVSVRVSPAALLSKKLVFSEITMNGSELNIEKARGGDFNIEGLASPKKTAPDVIGLWKAYTQKRDWFSRVYSIVKKKFSPAGREEEKAANKVTRVAEDLPKGKLVMFKTPAEMYLFEIRDLNINGSVNIIPDNAEQIELKNARINLTRLACDPQNGTRLDGVNLRGKLFKDNAAVGSMEVLFIKESARKHQTGECKVALKNVDLDAVRFVYEDSLPVGVAKGKISLVSDTRIVNEAIDSKTSIVLTGHTLEPKQGSPQVVGLVPIGVVCDAMNRIDPARLNFKIKGTLDNPEFGGFEETLLNLIKPYIANVGEELKTKGVAALGQMFKKTISGEE